MLRFACIFVCLECEADVECIGSLSDVRDWADLSAPKYECAVRPCNMGLRMLREIALYLYQRDELRRFNVRQCLGWEIFIEPLKISLVTQKEFLPTPARDMYNQSCLRNVLIYLYVALRLFASKNNKSGISD